MTAAPPKAGRYFKVKDAIDPKKEILIVARPRVERYGVYTVSFFDPQTREHVDITVDRKILDTAFTEVMR